MVSTTPWQEPEILHKKELVAVLFFFFFATNKLASITNYITPWNTVVLEKLAVKWLWIVTSTAEFATRKMSVEKICFHFLPVPSLMVVIQAHVTHLLQECHNSKFGIIELLL